MFSLPPFNSIYRNRDFSLLSSCFFLYVFWSFCASFWPAIWESHFIFSYIFPTLMSLLLIIWYQYFFYFLYDLHSHPNSYTHSSSNATFPMWRHSLSAYFMSFSPCDLSTPAFNAYQELLVENTFYEKSKRFSMDNNYLGKIYQRCVGLDLLLICYST